MRDLFNSVHPVRAISPGLAVANNTAFVSQIIDRKGYGGLLFLMQSGSLVDADATFTTPANLAPTTLDAFTNVPSSATAPDSQGKARELLAEAGTGAVRPRHINQQAPNGPPVALMCTAAPAALSPIAPTRSACCSPTCTESSSPR